MKKVIDGKRYDTATADALHEYDNGLGGGDFRSETTTLYRTKRGNFFLAGRGGAMSRWSRQLSQNSWGGGSGLHPVSEIEAREWAETHGMDADRIAEVWAVEDA